MSTSPRGFNTTMSSSPPLAHYEDEFTTAPVQNDEKASLIQQESRRELVLRNPGYGSLVTDERLVSDVPNSGSQGAILVQSKPGERGKRGKPGEDGEDGEPGKDGEDGEPGKDGEDGESGKDGEDGAACGKHCIIVLSVIFGVILIIGGITTLIFVRNFKQYNNNCPALRNDISVYPNNTVFGDKFETCQMNARSQPLILNSNLVYGYAINCTELQVYFEDPSIFDSPNYTSITDGVTLFEQTSSFIPGNYFATGSLNITLEAQTPENATIYVCIFSNLTYYQQFTYSPDITEIQVAIKFAVRCDNITAVAGSKVIHEMHYNTSSFEYLYGAVRSPDGTLDFVQYNLSLVQGFFNKSDFWNKSENYTFSTNKDVFQINLVFQNTCILFDHPPIPPGGLEDFSYFHVYADRIPYLNHHYTLLISAVSVAIFIVVGFISCVCVYNNRQRILRLIHTYIA